MFRWSNATGAGAMPAEAVHRGMAGSREAAASPAPPPCAAPADSKAEPPPLLKVPIAGRLPAGRWCGSIEAAAAA